VSLKPSGGHMERLVFDACAVKGHCSCYMLHATCYMLYTALCSSRCCSSKYTVENIFNIRYLIILTGINNTGNVIILSRTTATKVMQ